MLGRSILLLSFFGGVLTTGTKGRPWLSGLCHLGETEPTFPRFPDLYGWAREKSVQDLGKGSEAVTYSLGLCRHRSAGSSSLSSPSSILYPLPGWRHCLPTVAPSHDQPCGRPQGHRYTEAWLPTGLPVQPFLTDGCALLLKWMG